MLISIISGQLTPNTSWYAQQIGGESMCILSPFSHEEAVIRVIQSIFCGITLVGEYDSEVCSTWDTWLHTINNNYIMKIEILTGQITGSNAHKWWAEAKGTNSQGEDISMGVQMTNSTEEETIISLIRHVIRGPKFFKNDPDLQIIGDKYDDPDYEEKMAKDLPK